jgi:hypothetical protein
MSKKFVIEMSLSIKPMHQLMRVNSENVLDEGLRIGGRGIQMNSKLKIQTNKAKLGAC